VLGRPKKPLHISMPLFLVSYHIHFFLQIPQICRNLCAEKGKKAVTDLTRYRNLGELISINTLMFL
jgi:hypothetical protein